MPGLHSPLLQNTGDIFLSSLLQMIIVRTEEKNDLKKTENNKFYTYVNKDDKEEEYCDSLN